MMEHRENFGVKYVKRTFAEDSPTDGVFSYEHYIHYQQSMIILDFFSNSKRIRNDPHYNAKIYFTIVCVICVNIIEK